MKNKGFRLSKIMKEYVEGKYTDVMHEIGVKVRFDTRNIPWREIQVLCPKSNGVRTPMRIYHTSS